MHSTEDKASETEKIYFYSAQEKPYGCFSNFSAHGFELNGVWWPTSEHYFQASKFAGTPYSEQIRTARSPMIAARLGRSRKQPLRADWAQAKDDIMRQAVLRKFLSNKEIREVLLSTGNATLIERTLGDYYWGCGTDGSGLNMLGRILMEVRERLRGEQDLNE
ncbi:MAG TPA: NADAR family protein [Chloroflexia bacterium]